MAAQRHTEAKELVECLVADERVVIKAPTDADLVRWRKIVDFAKRHNLVPEGHRIEKAQQWNRDRTSTSGSSRAGTLIRPVT